MRELHRKKIRGSLDLRVATAAADSQQDNHPFSPSMAGRGILQTPCGGWEEAPGKPAAENEATADLGCSPLKLGSGQPGEAIRTRIPVSETVR